MAIDGQVRITANPHIFLKVDKVRVFTFSADPTFHARREDFQEKLVKALDAILATTATRTKAVKGIFCGKPPSWWTAKHQGKKAGAYTAARYMGAMG